MKISKILLLLFVNMVIGNVIQNDAIINTKDKRTSNSNSNLTIRDVSEDTEIPRVEASVTDVNSSREKWCYNLEKSTYEKCSENSLHNKTEKENISFSFILLPIFVVVIILVILSCYDNMKNNNNDSILPEYREPDRTTCPSTTIHISGTEVANAVASGNNNYHLPTYDVSNAIASVNNNDYLPTYEEATTTSNNK